MMVSLRCSKEAFKVSIEHLSDTIMWYRKHFHIQEVGDFPRAEQANYKDAGWKQITLPRAFNEQEAFKVSIEHLNDTTYEQSISHHTNRSSI